MRVVLEVTPIALMLMLIKVKDVMEPITGKPKIKPTPLGQSITTSCLLWVCMNAVLTVKYFTLG